MAAAFVTSAPVPFLTNRLELDDDIDEDEDDDSDDDGFGDDEDDDDDSDEEEDEDEPETWQVSRVRERQEYSESGRAACESPKGRLNLTFQPLTA